MFLIALSPQQVYTLFKLQPLIEAAALPGAPQSLSEKMELLTKGQSGFHLTLQPTALRSDQCVLEDSLVWGPAAAGCGPGLVLQPGFLLS